jgi:hypothetical protein
MILIFFLPDSLGTAGVGVAGVSWAGSTAGLVGGSAASASGILRRLGRGCSSSSSPATVAGDFILGLASTDFVCFGCTVSEGKATLSDTGALAK